MSRSSPASDTLLSYSIHRTLVWALCVTASAQAQSTVRPLPLQRWRDLGARAVEAALSPEPAGPVTARPAEAAAPTGERAQVTTREPDDPFGEPRVGAMANVRPFVEMIGQGRLTGSAANLTTHRGGFDATLGERDARGEFALHLFTEASFYDFGEVGGSLAAYGDPFNDLYRTGLGFERSWRDGERLEWVFGAEVLLGGEDEATPGDALQTGGLLAVRYGASDDGSLTIGVAGQTRLEDDPWMLPFLGFRWRASDDLVVELEGPEGRALYSLSDDWIVELNARYDLRQYRLNTAGPLDGGAFRDEEIRLTAGLHWRPKPDMAFGVEFGRVLWREVEFRDDDGHKLMELESEDSNWFGLTMSVSF